MCARPMRFCIRAYQQASLEGWHSSAACLINTFIGSHRKNNRPLGLSSVSLRSVSRCPNSCRHRRLRILYKHSCSRNKKNLADETPLPHPYTPLLLPPSLDHSSPQSSSGLLWDAGVLAVAMVIEEHFCHACRSSTEWVFPAWETQRIHQRLFCSSICTPLHR